MMSKKRKIGLAIYAVLIIVILIFIVFFAPDKWFQKKYDDIDVNNSQTNEVKKVDYETQIKNLTKNQYDYTYNLMHSKNKKTYIYECSGTINKDQETGSCTSPEKIEYNQDNKKKAFDKIDINLLDPKYIFELIKDIEYQKLDYVQYIEYTYTTEIDDLETEISVRSSTENIFDIFISNTYFQYHIQFKNIKV